jgi:HAD superfamily hydrolase (TIGR01509 family)
MALVIFDCDGVLVDSEVLSNGLLAEMMTELGHAMTTEEAVQKFAGRSLADVLALAQSVLGRPIPEDLGRQYGQRLSERLRHELKPVAGTKEAIAALAYPRCVASSSTFERIRLSLDVTGLAPLFGDNVFSATQVAHGKPAPDLYLFAADAMAAAPSACVVVEDSPLGVTGGVAAGMTVIGFTGAEHGTGLAQRLSAAGARRVIDSMKQLPATLAQLIR